MITFRLHADTGNLPLPQRAEQSVENSQKHLP